MASLKQEANRITVKWRLGGKRSGAPQTLSIPLPDGADPRDALYLATRAKDMVESAGHALTRVQVYRTISGELPAVGVAPRFVDWVGIYLADRRRLAKYQDDVQPDTLDGYAQILTARAVPYLGHRRLDEITPEVVRDWLIWVQRNGARRGGRPLSPGTVHRFHAVLHACLGAAVPEHIASNPAARPAGSRRRIPGMPKPVPFEGVFLERDELAAIQRCASPALAPLMFTLARTGLRLGEALELRIGDLALDGPRPHLRVRRALKSNGVPGAPKSAKSVRDVDIPDEVVAVLRPLVRGRRPAGLVFRTPTGRQWNKNNLRNQHWLPAVAAAQRCEAHPPPGPPKFKTGRPKREWRLDEVSTCDCPGRLKRTPRIHDLRHTWASALIGDGWTVVQVQRHLGHASATVTLDTYAHAWQRADNREVNDVGRLFATPEESA